MPTESTTNQIVLRPLTRDDWDLVMAWWGIPEVCKFTSTNHQPAFKDLAAELAAPNRRDFMLVYEGRRIGRTCLIDHADFEELSVYLGEVGLHGRGIGRAAVAATLDLATKPVRAQIDRDNHASIRIFMANGFVARGTEGGRIWLQRDQDFKAETSR